jgi:hypothetical protein
MNEEAHGRTASRPYCRSCQAEIDLADRFCRICGAGLTPGAGWSGFAAEKHSRTIAATMFLAGVAILLFAAVHRDPADLILVVGFALPLCGAGAVSWRMR